MRQSGKRTARDGKTDVELEHIFQVLAQPHWKVSGNGSAAEILGLRQSNLRARMRKLKIQREQSYPPYNFP